MEERHAAIASRREQRRTANSNSSIPIVTRVDRRHLRPIPPPEAALSEAEVEAEAERYRLELRALEEAVLKGEGGGRYARAEGRDIEEESRGEGDEFGEVGGGADPHVEEEAWVNVGAARALKIERRAELMRRVEEESKRLRLV
jgi:hypothetical protein